MKKSSQSLWLVLTALVLMIVSGITHAQSARVFAPDKMDTVLYGAAYYPEYMPYERLEQDVQLMQQAGSRPFTSRATPS